MLNVGCLHMPIKVPQMDLTALRRSNRRLHGINPYDYLVDVLQRVGQHPAARVAELTPRLWKQYFGDNPLRSNLYALAH
jgi:hypothetical protein